MDDNQSILASIESTNTHIRQIDQRLTEVLEELARENRASVEENRRLAEQERAFVAENREFLASVQRQERNIERLCNSWDAQLQLQATTVAALSQAVQAQADLASKIVRSLDKDGGLIDPESCL